MIAKSRNCLMSTLPFCGCPNLTLTLAVAGTTPVQKAKRSEASACQDFAINDYQHRGLLIKAALGSMQTDVTGDHSL